MQSDTPECIQSICMEIVAHFFWVKDRDISIVVLIIGFWLNSLIGDAKGSWYFFVVGLVEIGGKKCYCWAKRDSSSEKSPIVCLRSSSIRMIFGMLSDASPMWAKVIHQISIARMRARRSKQISILRSHHEAITLVQLAHLAFRRQESQETIYSHTTREHLGNRFSHWRILSRTSCYKFSLGRMH